MFTVERKVHSLTLLLEEGPIKKYGEVTIYTININAVQIQDLHNSIQYMIIYCNNK